MSLVTQMGECGLGFSALVINEVFYYRVDDTHIFDKFKIKRFEIWEQG